MKKGGKRKGEGRERIKEVNVEIGAKGTKGLTPKH